MAAGPGTCWAPLVLSLPAAPLPPWPSAAPGSAPAYPAGGVDLGGGGQDLCPPLIAAHPFPPPSCPTDRRRLPPSCTVQGHQPFTRFCRKRERWGGPRAPRQGQRLGRGVRAQSSGRRAGCGSRLSSSSRTPAQGGKKQNVGAPVTHGCPHHPWVPTSTPAGARQGAGVSPKKSSAVNMSLSHTWRMSLGGSFCTVSSRLQKCS